ncbi:histidine kinase N-terminal 7TM domain-containing protein [Natronorubrum texcoconense]|uniref:histidine kinase n=1 Tax=Natronorubrum texcoconense TaxID=1095776 RepID=A0A1G9D2Z3_9EURY|nr:histidine kinase N-terminal 7TM domain-containing protein [Natronorubrum texcoconense]SDK58316.1 Histidine kinase-, DNA gyrase B-, and HSP90-like ATPase [Natronorubrum texcoconense]
MYIVGLIAYAGSALIGGLLAVALLTKYDRRQPSFTFGLFLLVIGFWAAAYVGYLVASSEQWLLFFIQLSYLSVVSAPIVWLVFALQYTDHEAWLSRRRIALLSVVPAGVLTLVWTAPYHSLFYADTVVTIVDGVALLDTPPAIGHRINIIYAYGLLLVGTALIVAEIFTTNRLYRRQSLVLLACLSAPWVANGVFHLGVQPIPTADLTPVIFVLAGIPLAVIVQRTELTGFVPVAHERVFHTLDDPVFVVTNSNRILDVNRAARILVNADSTITSIEGSDITDVLPETLLDDGGLHPNLETAMECMIDVDGRPRQYIARVRSIDPDRQDPRGCIVSLTDITVQKRQQENLEAKNEQLERLASVVSHDLATPLATGESLVHLIRADTDDDDPELEQSLDDLEAVHARLREFAEALPELARESTDVESPVECDLESVAHAAWDVVDTGELTLVIESTRTTRGDPRRLQQAFENLFQNSVEHGSTNPDSHTRRNTVEHGSTSPVSRAQQDTVEHGSPESRPDDSEIAVDADVVERNQDRGESWADRITLPDEQTSGTRAATDTRVTTIRVGTVGSAIDGRGDGTDSTGRETAQQRGFYVEDDGRGIPPERREHLLEFGVSTGSGAGYGLAIVRTIVEAHGWSLEIGEAADGGARFEILEVD